MAARVFGGMPRAACFLNKATARCERDASTASGRLCVRSRWPPQQLQTRRRPRVHLTVKVWSQGSSSSASSALSSIPASASAILLFSLRSLTFLEALNARPQNHSIGRTALRKIAFLKKCTLSPAAYCQTLGKVLRARCGCSFFVLQGCEGDARFGRMRVRWPFLRFRNAETLWDDLLRCILLARARGAVPRSSGCEAAALHCPLRGKRRFLCGGGAGAGSCSQLWPQPDIPALTECLINQLCNCSSPPRHPQVPATVPSAGSFPRCEAGPMPRLYNKMDREQPLGLRGDAFQVAPPCVPRFASWRPERRQSEWLTSIHDEEATSIPKLQ